MSDFEAEVSELKTEVEEMKRRMLEMEEMRRQKDGEEKMESKAVTSEEEMSQFKNENLELLLEKKVKENERKILKMEGKTDTWFEISDCSYRKNVEQLQQLRNDIEIKFKALEIEFKRQMEKLQQTLSAPSGEKTKKVPRSIIPKNTSEINAEFSLPDRFLDIPQMTCFDLVLRNGHFKPDFTWQIEKQQGAELKVPQRSPIFTWTGYSLNAEITKAFDFSAAHLSLRMRAPHTFSSLPKPIPFFYCVLRDPSGKGRHKSQSSSFYSLRLEDLIEFRADGVDSILDLPDDVSHALEMDLYIEPFAAAQSVYSYDGTLNLAIDRYGKRKQLAEEKLVWYHESPYFYTGPKGYRVKVLMLLDVFDDGDYGLMALIRFVPGEFDDDLPRTFIYEASVTLVNRKEPDKSVRKTLKRNLRKGLECYVPLCKDQEIKNLLENDTLFYKVTIK